MLAYEYNTPPLMQLVDAQGQLPCPEHIWEAPSMEKIKCEAGNSGMCQHLLQSAVKRWC